LIRISGHLNGLVVLEPQVFFDERGFFMESFKASDFRDMNLPYEFIQDNHSGSRMGVLRGMHFQLDPPMGKLLRITRGSAQVVEVDIRPQSPSLGKWFSIVLSEENRKMLWVPPGFANGFLALTDNVETQYKCTAQWNKAGEGSILWNDPELAIEWMIENPILSDKDREAQTLRQWIEKSKPSAANI
jgi:dTDP-4-dehydrorhamnose 3,5-epimerase